MQIGRAISAGLIALIVLSLIVTWTAAPQPAATQQELSGWFHVIWGDGPPDSGVTTVEYVLIDDQGRWTQLLLDEDLTRPFGGPLAFNRKRVMVVGEWESVQPSEGDGTIPHQPYFQVDSIQFERPEDDEAAALEVTPLTGSQKWVDILCRFADSTGVTPHDVSWFNTLMGTSYPGMDHYWRELSYENINLTGSTVVGWYNLPQPRSYYVYDGDGDGDEDLDFQRTVDDCTAVADADVFFPNFSGINLMFNQNLDCCAWGGGSTLTRDGQTKSYSMTWIPPWGYENQYVLGHEMGHGFGLPHSSGPYTATYDSQWDVMSGGGTCSPWDANYGCIGVHTISYHKDELGWIPSSRKFVPTPGSSQTITIERLGQPVSSSNYLMAQIPIGGGGSATQFYTVEARRFAGYDTQIPGEAIIIHQVDTTRSDRLAQVVDADNNGNPNDAGAMWTPGETFTDAANGITVSVNAATTTGFEVTISYNPICIYPLSPTSQSFSASWGTGSVSVTAQSGCSWTAVSNVSWITIISGGSGNGNGTVTYSVASNISSSPNSRSGTLTIAGQTFTVTQEGGVSGSAFKDDMENGINGWSSQSPWAQTTTSSHSPTHSWTDSPSGNYQDNLNVSLLSPVINLAGLSSATLTFWHRFDFGSGDSGNIWVLPVGGSFVHLQSFTGTNTTWHQDSVSLNAFVGQSVTIYFQLLSDSSITGDGWYVDDVDIVVSSICTYSISPTSQSFPASGGTGSVSVTAGTGCGWTAVSNASWITITSGSSGTSGGTVTYLVAANTTTSLRTGTMTIAGQTFTVTQAGGLRVLDYYADVPEVRAYIDALAARNGWSVTHVDSATFATYTAAQIASFQVLFIASGWWGTENYSGLLSNPNVGGVVTGRKVITTLDPDWHGVNSPKGYGPDTMLSNAINWAGGGSRTGLVALDDNGKWWLSSGSILTGVLSGHIGDSICGNDVHITNPGHPVNSGLTDADLSNWNCSYHHWFTGTIPGFSYVTMDSTSTFGITAISDGRTFSGDYNLYVYKAPVGTQAAALVGMDLWNIPSGNNTVAMAGVDIDGDGVDEIAVMKNEGGDYNLYVYKAPVGTQAAPEVGRDLWNIPSGNNTIAMAGVDHDGDLVDEIAVMKNEGGDYNLYVYKAPVGTQAAPEVGRDLWNIPSGNNTVAMAGVDHDGDGIDEIAVMKNE